MMATRTVRPKEERLSEIEKKIAHHQHCIAALEEKKKEWQFYNRAVSRIIGGELCGAE